MGGPVRAERARSSARRPTRTAWRSPSRQYLRTNYDYSLRPPATGYDSPYAEFLFATRTGYCQHFAGAMAALLRFNGIPARVVVGFTAGEKERSGV